MKKKDNTATLTVNPDSMVDDQVMIVAFGKDADGELQVHHLNLDSLAWMLAKHQEGKKVIIKETGMQAVERDTASGT